MKFLRISLHSFVLAMADIGFIVVAFGVYYFLKPVNQIAVQAPVAAILCIAGFAAWSLIILRLALKGLVLQGTSELALTYLGSLAWIPFVFVPLHYVTQGYLTSMGNVLAIWLFQLPVNLLAIFAACKLTGMGKATDSLPDAGAF